ncbi:hypothetical protein VCHC17A1_3945A, partial [Vibrio cholerae HC-17A1]
MANLRKEA